MHHEDIKAAMRKKGVTPAALARHLQVSVQTVSVVIRGISTSAPVAAAIAKVCGLSVAELWPGRYDGKDDEAARVAAALGSRKGSTQGAHAARRKAA